MKLVCPSCMKNVEVPETALGTDFPCLVCGSKIPVPKNYAPSVAVPPVTPPAPAAPPGLAPPPLPTSNSPASAPSVSLGGNSNELGFSLSPSWMGWITPACLTVAFVLTFFTWVGSYPGGHRLFSQSAWGALRGDISPNTIGIKDLDEKEKKLESLTGTSKWLWLYALLLVITVALAWAERFVKDLKPATIPGPLAWLLPIWPMRFQLLTILSCVLLFLFLVQTWRGFGLENAVQSYVTEKNDADLKAADTTQKKLAVAVTTGQDFSAFALETTNWYWLALLAHIAAVLGILGRMWLAKRGNQPAPRFSLQY
jgi:hypothetical protein